MNPSSPDPMHAIHTLKAEILSPDWGLSPRRNNNISNAMLVLNIFFTNRRYAKGLVVMAKQLLSHLSKEQRSTPSAMDLLKEIMAHIVTLYEEEREDIATEKRLCARCLLQFKKLKIPVKFHKSSPNTFAVANMSLKHDIDQLHALSSGFTTLPKGKQIEAMLTIQSLIAETRELQKVMANQT